MIQPTYHGALSDITKLTNVSTQIRTSCAGKELAPKQTEYMQSELNAIRMEINNLRTHNVSYGSDPFSGNRPSAEQMISDAQNSILKFASDSKSAQSNITQEQALGLLV